MGETFKDRLEQLVTERRLTRADLQKMTGAGAGTVTEWFTKGAMPGGRHVTRLAEELGVTADWLLTGRGPRAPGEHGGAGSHVDPEELLAIAEDMERKAARLRALAGVPRRAVQARQHEQQDSATSLGEAAEASMDEHRRRLEGDNDASEPTGTDGGGR